MKLNFKNFSSNFMSERKRSLPDMTTDNKWYVRIAGDESYAVMLRKYGNAEDISL
jgi:hypothetical protein